MLNVLFVPPPLVTVADYANADPAVVKSGRVKKAVANAVEKEGSRRHVDVLHMTSVVSLLLLFTK